MRLRRPVPTTTEQPGDTPADTATGTGQPADSLLASVLPDEMLSDSDVLTVLLDLVSDQTRMLGELGDKLDGLQIALGDVTTAVTHRA